SRAAPSIASWAKRSSNSPPIWLLSCRRSNGSGPARLRPCASRAAVTSSSDPVRMRGRVCVESRISSFPRSLIVKDHVHHLLKLIDHNRYMVLAGLVVAVLVLSAFGCQAQIKSPISGEPVTRAELVAEAEAMQLDLQ